MYLARKIGVLSGAIAMAVSGSALAQDEQGDVLEEVVVTGSYLYTGVDSPSPVSVFDGEDLVNFAPPDMATFFFDNVPQNYGSDNISQTDAGGMARSRANRNATINLRGLGDENSLTVLNGRRTIGYPVPDGTGWNRVDINSLVPRIALQRVELLLDGGSAIFGSDPVAGVANFVTNNNFRGFDIAVDSRILDAEPDAGNYTVAALWGIGNDRTSLVTALEYHDEEIVLRRDIDDSFDSINDVTPDTGIGLEDQQGFGYTNGGMGMGAANWVDPLCGSAQFGDLAYYPAYEDPADEEIREVGTGSTPGAAATQCARSTGFDNGFDLYQNNTTQIIAFARLEHDFTDSLRFNLEANYSDQEFADVDRWGDGGTGGVWSPNRPQNLGIEYALPATHPGILHAQSIDPTFGAAGMGTGPIYAIDETLPYLATMPAFNDNQVKRVALGIEGDFNANWSWLFDTSSASSEVANGIRDPIVSRYPAAVAGLGGPNCDAATGTPGQGDCFYYNPFMSNALPDAAAMGLANDPGMLEWLIPNRVDRFEGNFFSADFRITGQFGELPGGPIGVAFGVGYREDEVIRDAAESVNLGLTATTGVVNDFAGKQDIESLYFEFALPIHEDVNLQIAAREETYDIGFSELSPKIAAIWTPTDRLTVRGSWGTSFKGPSISQTAASTQFQGGGANSVLVDGVRYGAMGMTFFAFETRANPNLQPQLSENISVGFDYNATDNISFGASWVQIQFEDRIVAPTANVVSSNLNCIVTDNNGIPIEDGNGNLNWIPLDQGGCVIPFDATQPIDQNNRALVVSFPTNLDYLDAAFLDVHARMNWDTSIGALSFTPSVTYVTEYEFPLPEGAVARDGLCPNDICSSIARNVGMGFSNGINNMPRWQGNFPVNLSVGNHNFRLNTSYRDSLNDDVQDLDPTAAATANFEHEEGQWLVDLQWNWQINNAASVGFSTRNLLATEPPETSSNRFSRRLREYTLQFRYRLDTD
jgi:iron complex outermembrane receptor protein